MIKYIPGAFHVGTSHVVDVYLVPNHIHSTGVHMKVGVGVELQHPRAKI